MKTYIILTPEIGNMGGAQMYTQNKVAFLKKKGWRVLVLYYIYSEKILLPELVEYKDFCFLDFAWGVKYIPMYRFNRFINRIKEIVGAPDELIVESHLLLLSFWGEIIAKNLNGRHVINCLEERVSCFSPKELSFFEFKLYRWEFMNSDEPTLRRVFKKSYKESYLEYYNYVDFVCSNVAVNSDEKIDLPLCDFSISSIGRLDKYYILPMFEEIKHFANKYIEKKINVIVIGGSQSGNVEDDIKEMFVDTPNVRLFMFGYMYPIPDSILRTINVSIACANSVLVTSNLNIPTICVDTNDSQAIGVFGYTTNNRFVRETEPPISISSLLEDILVNNKYPKKDIVENTEEDKEFIKQMRYLEKSSNNSGYYDVINMYSKIDRFISRFKWFIKNLTNNH